MEGLQVTSATVNVNIWKGNAHTNQEDCFLVFEPLPPCVYNLEEIKQVQIEKNNVYYSLLHENQSNQSNQFDPILHYCIITHRPPQHHHHHQHHSSSNEEKIIL